MKIALYIEDGLEQIVLTPESKTEKSILGKLHDGSRELSIKRGSFYECLGGWQRYAPSYWTSSVYSPSEQRSDESTLIVLRPASADTHPQGGDPAQTGAPAPLSGAVPAEERADAHTPSSPSHPESTP